jgi:hypothetical protein
MIPFPLWFVRCELCGKRLRRTDFMELKIGQRRLFIGHVSCFSRLPEQTQKGFFAEWRARA